MKIIENYCIQIKKNYPDLKIETIILNKQGQYNDVLVVNKSLIFRFAKVSAAIDTLKQEMILLQSLQDHITLKIPNPLYHNVETDMVGEAFLSYPILPGKSLWRDKFKAIEDTDALERMSAELSTFLYELHHISAHIIMPIAPTLRDTHQAWVTMYNRIKTNLFKFMRMDACHKVAHHFEYFLDNPSWSSFEPVLRHGDFGTDNIIYDPINLSIVGIIDFGSAGLGDPAVDFAGLLSSYGEKFYEQCAVKYPEMKQAKKRVQFYYGTFALQEALFGIENDDKVAFQNGISEYV